MSPTMRSSPRAILLRHLAAITTVALATSRPTGALTLARRGEVPAPILLASDASPSERTAAQELVSYLSAACSAKFRLESEPPNDRRRPRIVVGPTEFAKTSGIDCANLGPEEWVIATNEDALILCGGRPRGTLYAVYHFLEDFLGVRWWNPFEESVPRRRRLEVGSISLRGKPAFRYRDVHGIDGPRSFCARNRLNGAATGLSREFGGAESFGPPHIAHTFYLYLPPEEFFEAHPEFYSERTGVRVAEDSQLCLTQPGLVPVIVGRLRAFINSARKEASASGEPPPRFFDISQNDWRGSCECDRCKAVAAREGSQSGPLIEFVNKVADAVKVDYPDVMIATLAYDYTFRPPKLVAPRENVLVRFSSLQRKDFTKPIFEAYKGEVRDALIGWSTISRHLWVWDYAVTFGDFHSLPVPSYRNLAEDFRFYLEHGVEGLFVQHDYPIAADMRDLKLWTELKLMENPDRDVEALALEFTRGFYGRAGRFVMEYLDLLDAAAKRKPSIIRFAGQPSDYAYLDLAFLVEADRLFQRAERAVGGDRVRRRRVNHARLSLDRAILILWPELLKEHAVSGRAKQAMPLDREEVLRRYRRTWDEQIGLRVPEPRQQAERSEAEAELNEFLDLKPEAR